MRGYLAIAAVIVLVAASGCGSATPVSATPTITENFSGTVPQGGSDSHSVFNVTQYGEVDVTLTAVGPPSTITEGLAIGNVTNGTCSVGSVVQGTTPAASTPQFANPLNAGAYCVTIFDAGNQAGPITYTLTVLHP